MKFSDILLTLWCNLLVNAKYQWDSLENIYDTQKVEGRYTRNIKEYEIIVPEKINEDSSFLSYVLPHYYEHNYYKEIIKRQTLYMDKRKRDDPSKVNYKVQIDGKILHLALVPNWKLVPPSMVLETREVGGNKNVNNLNIRHIAPYHKCHFIGTIKNEEHSRVAISTCNGLNNEVVPSSARWLTRVFNKLVTDYLYLTALATLAKPKHRLNLEICVNDGKPEAGFIKTSDDSYFIEPLKNEEPKKNGEHLHVVYKKSPNSPKHDTGTCGTSDDWENAWKGRLEREAFKLRSHQNIRITKRSQSKSNFIETLVVADKHFLDHHNGTDVETYILTIMNMASEYFHDASIGNDISLTVVRILYLEKEEDTLDLSVSENATKTLESFCKWQKGITPKVGHPNHHDVAVLLTRYDLCDKGSCGLLGLAYVATACEPDKSCCINEDSGLILGVTVAHEIGHIMGCSHDEVEVTGCPPQSKNGFYHVMSPRVHMSTNDWSECSQKFMSDFLDLNLGECLSNEPSDHSLKENEMLPGAMYDADTQCSMIYGPNIPACATEMAEFCETLYCKTNSKYCTTNSEPPADGTKCGNNKWCFKKECIQMGSMPDAVNGGWGEWSPASKCSRTCGGGVSFSERKCDNPKPSHKGKYCLGERKRYTICNTNPCDPEKPTFRETQCSEKESLKIQGKHHKWKPYLNPKGNPCELFCINEKNIYMKLEARVKDGTPCKSGTLNMCVAGICRNVGCDWKFDSNSIEDVCGICHGDGTQCEKVDDIYTQSKGNGYVEVTVIPKNSRNIEIEELAATENTIAISRDDRLNFYLNGGYKEEQDGEYNFGSNAIGAYYHPEPDKEKLDIYGPTMEDLVLYVVYYGGINPGVKYSYYVPKEGSKSDSRYFWEFLQWGDCSVACGGGIQFSEPNCVEESAGEVSSSFCKSIAKPERKEERCNEFPCKTRWKVGTWTRCLICKGRQTWQFREVLCIKKAGRTTDEEVVTNNSECQGKPPPHKQLCKRDEYCRRRREPKRAETRANIEFGAIAMDPLPKDEIKIIEVPIKQNKNVQTKLSDEAYQKLGDKVALEIDKKHAKICKGNAALNCLNKINKHHP